MNVLMVGHTYYESDNRVRRYADSLVRKGDDVEVIALRQKGQPFSDTIHGVKLFRIQIRELKEKTKFDYLAGILLFLFNSFFYISLRHFKKKFDFIHVHSVPDFEVFAALIPKLTGAKVILDIHDMVPEFYAGKFHTSTDSLLFRTLTLVERISCLFSDHVIISNHIWGERLVKRSVRKEKCSVILNYPDPYIFNRTHPKRDTGKFIMMYPGTIAWHQGIDIAVRAMALIRDKNPLIEFHIYGKGPEEANIAKLIFQYDLSDKVKLLGGAAMEIIVEKMMDVDLGIVPKRGDDFGGEAFSTKILEFMAMGIPMLIAETRIDRYYFNDDLVTFFKSGDEKDLADKLLFLASHTSRTKQQCERALKYIEKNNWNVKKDEYFTLVNSLVEKK